MKKYISFSMLFVFLIIFNTSCNFQKKSKPKKMPQIAGELNSLEIDDAIYNIYGYFELTGKLPPDSLVHYMLDNDKSILFKKGNYRYLKDDASNYVILYSLYPLGKEDSLQKIFRQSNRLLDDYKSLDSLKKIHTNLLLYKGSFSIIDSINSISYLRQTAAPLSIKKVATKRYKYLNTDVIFTQKNKRILSLLKHMNILTGKEVWLYFYYKIKKKENYYKLNDDIKHMNFSFFNLYFYDGKTLKAHYPYHYKLPAEKEKQVLKMFQDSLPDLQYIRFSVIAPNYKKYLLPKYHSK